jgi:hypothetical protein
MSTEAFGSRRVTEALRAIHKYLDDGARLAGGVPPGKVVKLELEETPSVPGPRLRTVLWADTNSRVIEVGPGETTLDVLVTGTNLATCEVFKLVAAGSPTIFFQTEDLDPQTAFDFTATITLTNPPPDSYHALVVTETGQTFLLRNALVIEEPGDSDRPAPEPGLQLGALTPNEQYAGEEVDEAVLLLLRGRASDVSEVYVTDRNGVRKDWGVIEIEPGEPVAVKGGRGHKHHHRWKGAETVLVTFTVPQDETPDTYILVAKSTTLNSQDGLAFHVIPGSPVR